MLSELSLCRSHIKLYLMAVEDVDLEVFCWHSLGEHDIKLFEGTAWGR